LTYTAVSAVVLPVILMAAALPAWRASSIDPMVALRNE
jgi:ABC-type lipoprotein release transport system permease subunit